MTADRDIGEVLGELGFADPASEKLARAALEAAGLTNPRKTRFSADKVARVRELLDQSFARACADPACQAAMRSRKPKAQLITVLDTRGCENCGGSDNLKAIRRLADSCRRHGITRVVIVGGSPSVRVELEALKPPEWQLRLVDGTERRTQDKAKADLEWAQLVLIWGASELDHKVSRLYTDSATPLRRKVVQIARRGIAALLNAGADHVDRHS